MKRLFQPIERQHEDGCGHVHHHEEECGCGHAHHHEEECGCGHAHHQEEECGCGHAHHHEEECGCGHAHHQEECDGEHKHYHGEEGVHERHIPKGDAAMKQVFLLENLGCANCAAKMERKIAELPEVEDAVITYSTKQLWLYAEHGEEMLPKIQEICSSIEPEVKVVFRDAAAGSVKKEKEAERKKKREEKEEQKKNLAEILSGAVLLAAGILLERADFGMGITLPVFVLAYLILGGKIILTAIKNIGKGQIFDENFLMSLATIGAFAIREYPEAVGVMLFFRIGEYFEELAVKKSRGQIMDAVDMRPEVVNLIKGDETRVIGAEEAQKVICSW